MTSNNNDDDAKSNHSSSTASSFDEIEERIIYTTEDGFEILPEYETSCLMALEMQREMEEKEQKKKERDEKKAATATATESNNKNDDDNDAKSPSSNNGSSPTSAAEVSNDFVEIVSDFSRLFENFERDSRLEAERKAQQWEDRSAADENNKNKTKKEEQDDDKKAEDSSTSTATKSQDQPQQKHQEEAEAEEEEEEEESYDYDNEENEMEGMIQSNSAMGLHREETDQSQWKLEAILLRKSVPVQYDEDEVEFEDDDPRAVGHSVTSKRKAKKEFSYLCKWAPGGRCTTWELRSLLVEEGFGPDCDAYDMKIKEKGISAKKERTDFKPPCEYGKIAARDAGEKGKVGKKKTDEGPAQVQSHQQFFESLIPSWKETLRRKFRDDRLELVNIARCAPKQAATQFISHFETLTKSRQNPTVQMTYHGTSVAGINGIMNDGLVVPGNLGVRVANASAYGVKIYTASNPSTSTSYDRTGWGVMFACVGIPTDEHTHGSYICYAESQKVCPVFLCHYRRGASTHAGDIPMLTTAKLLKTASLDANRTNFVKNDPLHPPPVNDLSTHEKKILRQKRHMLGLERISI